MNAQKFAAATFVGAVTSFIAGFLIYGLALSNFMTEHMMAGTMKDPPAWVHLGLAQIVSGALLTVAIGVWAKTSGAGAGLTIGATLGLLMCLSFDLMMYSTSNVMTDFSAVIADVVGGTVLNGLTGAAVGAVLARR